MKLPQAIQILRDHNAWRRDDTGDLLATDPTLLGQAIDAVLAHHSVKGHRGVAKRAPRKAGLGRSRSI